MFQADAMSEDFQSGPADRTLASPPGLRSASALRSKRVSLFLALAAIGSGFYAIHDVFHAAYGTAFFHGLATVFQGVARYQQKKHNKLNLASQLLLLSIFLSMGVTPLFDGNIRSPGLWCASVLPIAASLLLGRRAVLRYTLGVVAIIALNLGASFFIEPHQPITRYPMQWAVMRVAILLVFTGISLASGTASRRARKEISKRTQELELQAKDANVAHRSKAMILATMSHEVRMPMQGVLALIAQSRELRFGERFSFVFDTVSDQAQRVLRLLDALLDLANLQSGRAKLEEKNFSLGVLLDRVHLKHEKIARSNGTTLRTRSSVGPRTFVGDAKRIYQLVSALVSNAIKFSERGEIEVLAQFQSQSYDPMQAQRVVVISVRDQGIGMNADQLSRVFGQFEQVHENLDAQLGSWGLGLAIAHQIARSMEGKLEASSEPGKGSTFTLTLPLKEDEVISTTWSDCLPVEDLHPIAPAPSSAAPLVQGLSASEKKHLSLIRNLAVAMLPLVFVCTVLGLYEGRHLAASMHAICAALMGLACLSIAQLNRKLRSFLLLSSIALSMSTQALIDGTIQSEALWTIGVVPVLAAFLFDVKLSFITLGLSIALIAHLTLAPTTPFHESYLGDGLSTTVLLRLASLFAYAGSSLAISKSDLAMMTEKRRQQRSVEALRKLAVSANEEKNRFLARIRNELGAPIQHIVELTRGTSRDRTLSPEQKAQLKTIQRCTSQIEQLIGRSIDYAVADGLQSIVKTQVRFDLQELMLDICRVFSPPANRNHRYLQFVDDAPETWVYGDPSGVFEVVAVLLSHAIRSGDPGPIFLSLTQTSASDASTLCFEIGVRCTGLALDDLQRTLVDAQSQAGERSGSILECGPDPVLRGLVAADACGGSIGVWTRTALDPAVAEAGAGLVFRIELPSAREEAVQQAA